MFYLWLREMLDSRVGRVVPYRLLKFAYRPFHFLEYEARMAVVRRVAGVREVSSANLAEKRDCTTVFILGSGSSINEISGERWQAIASHDSIGFNFWPVHSHVPTIYAIETPRSERVRQRFLTLIDSKRNEYRNVPILVADDTPTTPAFLRALQSIFGDTVFAMPTQSVLARNSEDLRDEIKRRRISRLFRSGPVQQVFKYHGSLTSMISLSARMGYKNIVLCGVDMSHADYFFEDSELYPDWHGYEKPEGDRVHATARREPFMVPAQEVIYAIQDMLLGPSGRQIFVENRSSLLHPRIPLAPDHLFDT